MRATRLPGGASFASGSLLTVSDDERRICSTQIDRVESDLMLVEQFR